VFKVAVGVIDSDFLFFIPFNFLLTLTGVVKTACAVLLGLLLNTSMLHCCSFLFQCADLDLFPAVYELTYGCEESLPAGLYMHPRSRLLPSSVCSKSLLHVFLCLCVDSSCLPFSYVCVCLYPPGLLTQAVIETGRSGL